MSISAVLLMRERRLVGRLRRIGATDATAAHPLADLHGVDRLALKRLRERGVIRESAAGSCYLDEASWAALRSKRRRIVAVVVGVALVMVLGAYFGLAR